jgi:antirestriction protein ArdC
MRAIYESVTNQIIAELKAGAIPWTQPWKNQHRGGVMPQNAATGRPYSGVNIPILWHAAHINGFPSHEWMTFQQAIQRSASVRKGSKGTTVVFTTRIERDDDVDDKTPRSMLKTYHVFNVDQIEGLPDPPSPPANKIESVEVADAFIQATGADIRLGGSKACYVPTHDFVALPPKEAFENTESFYAVSLHELGHWSGSEKRLNRNLDNRFGTRAYAAEELIAELNAAFLCAHLGITGELRHAGYIDDWICLLSEDKRAIFTAASKASEAANFLRAFSEANIGDDHAD